MDKSVFISRELPHDSIFRSLLTAAGFEIHAFSLLEFRAIGFLSPPSADWVFCYSARSVDFFLQGLAALGLPAAGYPHYAALGSGTAAALIAQGITPDFTGSGQPEATATAFLEVAAGQRVLFPRAGQSRQSVQRLLKDQLIALDLVVYDNQIRAQLHIPPSRYAVFTSPLNAQAYFGQLPATATLPRLIAIGNTTARALEQLGARNFRIAAEASEQGLAKVVLDWEKL